MLYFLLYIFIQVEKANKKRQFFAIARFIIAYSKKNVYKNILFCNIIDNSSAMADLLLL